MFFFLDMTICAWCCRKCDETQTSRWNESCHESIEQTRRVFIRSLGDEEHMDLVKRVVAERRRRIPSTNGRTAMMRASGRSIPRTCCV